MKHHPEQLDTEIYMGNTTLKYFSQSGHKTKRLGQTVLDNKGNIIVQSKRSEMSNLTQFLYPWFVTRYEIEQLSQEYPDKTYYKDMLKNGQI